MKFNTLLVSALTLATLASPFALANDKSAHGSYVAKSGSVETLDITENRLIAIPQQLGTFSIVLKHNDWKNLTKAEKAITKKKIKISGVLKGKINPLTFKASHVMVGKDNNFLIRSADDVLSIEGGDLFCAMGVPMKIREYVNLTEATGEFANLITGTLVLTGTIDNCPSSPTFGQNTLSIVADEGQVSFY